MKTRNGINITGLTKDNFSDEAFKEGVMTDDQDMIRWQINMWLEERFISKEAVLEVAAFVYGKVRAAICNADNPCDTPVKRCGYNKKAHKLAVLT